MIPPAAGSRVQAAFRGRCRSRVNLVDLQLEHFRNLRCESIPFSDGINLIIGRNGQGKSSLLEAIYLLGYGKSWRTAVARECVRHGEAESVLRGTVRHGNAERRLQVLLSRPEKRLYVNGREAALEEFAGQLHVLAFAQIHLSVIRGGPAERRAFLDRAMITSTPGHVRHLANYVRAVRQRNRLLGGARGTVDERQLEGWDEAMVREGARILWNRLRYVDGLKEVLPPRLFGNEEIKLHYVATAGEGFEHLGAVEGKMRERIRASREQDYRMGCTTVGPHRDDLKIFIDGKAAGTYGSAGQQRSALLSLYFAQMEMHYRCHQFYPVFLVDDVEAELDHQRLAVFLEFLAARTQTFMTTAKEETLPKLPGPVTRLRVEQGIIECDRNPGREPDASGGPERGTVTL